jgi:uncharacterized protein YodC (DUF2158 family)
METEMKVGDVVRLKSSSPRMTVKSIDGDQAICQWFTDKKEHKEDRFPLSSLVVVD